MSKTFFITGIGTEIGKTVVSAIFTEVLKADYWKPVQAGDLDNSDTMKVQDLISNSQSKFHPEQYRLNHPMSPHAAADLDGVNIKLTDFEIPKTDNALLIEGAGGLFVPLNHEDCMIDLIKYLNVPVILVSQNYLGSINHTLLSINALMNVEIPIAGVVFNGEPNAATEAVIEKMTGVQVLGKVGQLGQIDKEAIREAGLNLNF
ncbi:MAG: dethiobiotin synthetase [Paraglaciecola sp.]|jgi:dethiobiotin synthetase